MMKRYITKANDETPHLRQLLDTITQQGVPDDAEIIYHARNTIYKMCQGDELINVKAFHRPNFFNRIIYTTLRKSKARRSFENAMRLLTLGFETPQPIGYGEVHNGCLLCESYYVSCQIEAQEMRYWEKKPDCIPLLKALARDMARLHQAGVWHKDFSPGNILYTGTAVDGYQFYYIDLNRGKFGVKSHKRLMSMFRSINLNVDETARLAQYYAEAIGDTSGKVETEAVSALNGYLKSRRRRAWVETLLKKIYKE